MTTVIDTVKQHSPYGGSSIGRVIACGASAAACASIPAMPDDEYNSEGTAAHFVAAECLRTNVPAKEFLDYLYTKPGSPDDGTPPVQVKVTGNMVDAVQVFLDEVNREMALTPDAELYVEHAFQLENDAAPGEVWGETDALVYHPSTGRLRDFDYKHGIGVSVSAEDNAQPKFYAAGAVFSHPEWRITEIICTIVQPRARDVDEAGAVKDWTFDGAELLEFVQQVEDGIRFSKKVAEIFADPNPTVESRLQYYTPGVHCRWCAAAGDCPGKEAATLAAATLDRDGITSIAQVTAAALPDPKTFDVERLAAIVAGIDIVREWQLRAQELLEGLLMTGHQVPGWKVVDKQGRAKWVDEPARVATYAAVEFGLDEDQTMPRKLATITDMVAMLKSAGATKEQIDDFKLKFTIKESSGLTIAPASDRRPAVNAAETNFGSAKL